jgi:hypothetical protein
MGIDATIPENVPRNRYNRIVYFNQHKVKLADVLKADGAREQTAKAKPAADLDSTVQKVSSALAKSHRFFAELLELFPQIEFRTLAAAVGVLHQTGRIGQDSDGKYALKEEA